mmetsp:Transcript_241/g.832  ORF Transcript_241/g.832 Transcript_241/m.832 type:complete len:286 (+) Transcript_241:47-904(+)
MAGRDRGGTSRDRGGTAHTIIVDNSKAPPAALVYPQEELRKMLTAYELEIFDTINQARTNPQRMVERLEEMKQYYTDDNCFRYPGEPTLRTKEGVAAVDEAIEELRALIAAPLAPMALWKGLIYSCRDHVSDQWRAENSPTGHQGTDNSNPPARGSRYGEWGLLCGEALSYGEKEPFRVVAYLLVDDGREERPHRKRLLGMEVLCAGVAAGAHKRCGSLAVVMIADKFEEDKEIETDWARDPVVEGGYKKAAKKNYFAKNEMVTKTKITHQGKNPKKKKKGCCIM